MPRIDPIQLLKCLGVLLSPSGGIKSGDEVRRLASLMTKFSKKLVSKCIYIQILKCTETELLGMFMVSGGWKLVHMWLTESIVSKNWPLVKELLELLLLCPVDTERLKTNNCPKLVKELSKDGNHVAIRALASKLVEQWLRTVKGEHVIPISISEIPQIITDANVNASLEALGTKTELHSDLEDSMINDNEIKTNGEKTDIELKVKTETDIKSEQSDLNIGDKIKEEKDDALEALPVLKISLKDGKQVVSESKNSEKKHEKEKSKHRSKDRSSEKSSSSKSSSSKHRSHSSSDKRKSSDSPSSHRSKDKEKSKDKERHSSHSSSKSSSKHNDSSRRSSSSSSRSSRDDKSKDSSNDKNKEEKSSKDSSRSNKETEKSDQPSIQKLGKIPKLSDKKEKPSISIEVRKPDEPKPKTVKTFHSRFRKHGLEEEVKPPPSRAALLNKKPPPALPPTVSIPKRPSPVHNDTPPEKKLKTVEIVEKPGAIKLIPPKPKPVLLLESDMFMDALNASATNKKEPKKRKRRTSGSKDGNPASDGTPPHTPTQASPAATPPAPAPPPRFYKDTLDVDDDKDKPDKDSDHNNTAEITSLKSPDNTENTEPHTRYVNGLKGVLCYHKRKGPKKSIKWKPESELEEIQYFELDETERVNVTKTFTDMKHLERIHERDAFQKGRNLSVDDVMEEKTSWRPLIPFDAEGQIRVEYGKLSKEKDIQAVRQKGTLQPLYFHKSMIPDSPLEPDVETHTYSEPGIIPLDDITGNQDNVSDFRNVPWPEPKGTAPPVAASSLNVPMFQQNIPQFPNGFPNAQFPAMPGFQPPNMVPPGDWQNGVHMMPGGMPAGPMPPGPMAPGNMPGMMVPPDNMMMAPDMFGVPNPMFQPVPPDGFMMDGMNMPPNMFPPDFNMAGGQGPPGQGADNFSGPGFRGSGGPLRGRGAGGHWRGKGPGWDGPPRGRGGGGPSRGGRKACIYFQRKGSCRQGDNCTFLHPGVNCPY